MYREIATALSALAMTNLLVRHPCRGRVSRPVCGRRNASPTKRYDALCRGGHRPPAYTLPRGEGAPEGGGRGTAKCWIREEAWYGVLIARSPPAFLIRHGWRRATFPPGEGIGRVALVGAVIDRPPIPSPGGGAPRSESLIYMIAGGNHTIINDHIGPIPSPSGEGAPVRTLGRMRGTRHRILVQ